MPSNSDMRLPASRRRLLTIAALLPLAALLPAVAPARADALAEGAEAVVQAFADQGVLLLEDKSALPAQRAEQFRGMLHKFFALDAIARWVLARYWAQFNSAEHTEYRQLFEDLVVYGYVKRFGEYTGQRLHIGRTVADSASQATVFSTIDRADGGQPIRVDWKVGSHAGAFMITDVVVENVSLSQTWRSDFTGTIQQGGPAALLTTLRERTRQLKADLGVAG